jgi:hypothetical protein
MSSVYSRLARVVPFHRHDFAARFKVANFNVCLTVRRGRAVCEWTPRLPRRGELTSGDLAEYRRSRDAALQQLSSNAGFIGVAIDLLDA